eukprot:scaffold1878_cov258-Pinguiococcus_pyrenoidosus.AAC.7
MTLGPCAWLSTTSAAFESLLLACVSSEEATLGPSRPSDGTADEDWSSEKASCHSKLDHLVFVSTTSLNKLGSSTGCSVPRVWIRART